MPRLAHRLSAVVTRFMGVVIIACSALTHFSPAPAIAGVLFSVWQNISGALLSNDFHTRPLNAAANKEQA
ncbi:MAG: hypothetical protein LUG19_13595 [Desulfovibrio sp.]|uniref:hypothetical protein n=1 Tax=Desulfovibrio sp. TaxID=885 RepID=UPI00258918D1|nr:hypothetical protein [Desulfovibrio sp.]MCD7985261.1 hypothetical protein [Desulfovibrio sp.]